jgi:hypothetical protein
VLPSLCVSCRRTASVPLVRCSCRIQAPAGVSSTGTVALSATLARTAELIGRNGPTQMS